MTVANAEMTVATPAAQNGYLFSSTTFNTPTVNTPPTNADQLTLQQLGGCQAQIAFHSGTPPTNTWALADVGVSYVGAVAPPPVTLSPTP